MLPGVKDLLCTNVLQPTRTSSKFSSPRKFRFSEEKFVSRQSLHLSETNCQMFLRCCEIVMFFVVPRSGVQNFQENK